MQRDSVVPIQTHDSHSHFYASISSFNNQPHHKTMQAEHEKTMKMLRKEFYSTDDSPHKSSFEPNLRNLLQKLLQAANEETCRVLP